MNLYLMRHGETQENAAQILQGHMPGHLTTKGREQAAQCGERLAARNDLRFTLIMTSDLQRTIDTAAIINQNLGLPIRPTQLLRERDWGELTGHPIAEVRQMPELPRSVETVGMMYNRARMFLNAVLALDDAQNVLAVTHGMFARCLQAVALGSPYRDIAPMLNAEVRPVALSTYMANRHRKSGIGKVEAGAE